MTKSIMVLITLSYFFSASIIAQLSDTVEKIKPSVVGVGVYTPTGRPQNTLQGSGFVIGDGSYIVTNHHVVSLELNQELLQELAIFVGTGKSAKVRTAKLIASSQEHDLAILKVTEPVLPALKLADNAYLKEGSYVAFTGFPIGAVLGLYPVTHRGIIAAVTPTIIPVDDSRQISIQMLKRMRDPYLVYQLDATAYPGNSGSALYDVETGQVVGIINKVFIQQSKEAVFSNPSGITYAIPVKYLKKLLDDNNINY